jgi:aspartyl-tRNA(Asn)/glutamyl-tRNA(Gln) amidotransferase subunit C
MAVTFDDVRHIASLARLGVDDARLPALAAELNGILGHMDVLQRVDVSGVPPEYEVGVSAMPLRADDGAQYPLAVPRESFAPAMRDGFFLVPRLATHEDPEA